jgi:hypothetical protein
MWGKENEIPLKMDGETVNECVKIAKYGGIVPLVRLI